MWGLSSILFGYGASYVLSVCQFIASPPLVASVALCTHTFQAKFLKISGSNGHPTCSWFSLRGRFSKRTALVRTYSNSSTSPFLHPFYHMMYPIIENKVSQYHITKEALLSFLRTLFPGILDNEFNVKVLLVDHILFRPKRLLIGLQSKNDRWKFNAPRTIEDVSHYKS
jgi:hypothetical protein